MNYTYKSFSSDDTLNFAKNLASKLQKKDVIVLTGELGSGKTKFVEGILSYFNLEVKFLAQLLLLLMNIKLLNSLFFTLMFIVYLMCLSFMKSVEKNILRMEFV